MQFQNCTPHTIFVTVPGGLRAFEPSGILPRVAVTATVCASIDDVAISMPVYGALENLPPERPGVGLIVSAMVADAVAREGLDRGDIYSPDTGADAIREAGQVKAVRRLLYRGGR